MCRSMPAPRPRSHARTLATRLAFAVVAVCTLAGILALWRPDRPPAPRPDPDEAGFDAPDAAARFSALKRAPAAGTGDMRQRYRLAAERVSRFARYSSRAGRTLSRVDIPASGAAAAPTVWA